MQALVALDGNRDRLAYRQTSGSYPVEEFAKKENMKIASW